GTLTTAATVVLPFLISALYSGLRAYCFGSTSLACGFLARVAGLVVEQGQQVQAVAEIRVVVAVPRVLPVRRVLGALVQPADLADFLFAVADGLFQVAAHLTNQRPVFLAPDGLLRPV